MSDEDGISLETVYRFDNIKYIAPLSKSIGLKIQYIYAAHSDKNKQLMVLEELYPGKYHILSNNISNEESLLDKALMDKLSAIELIEFTSRKKSLQNLMRSRVENYNTLINKGIIKNMFLERSYDIKEFEKKSQTIQPSILQFNIENAIFDLYKTKSKPIKNISAFSKLLHNEEIIKLATDTLTKEYNLRLKKNMDYYRENNISISEIYISFLSNLDIYERDFKKNLHDEFMKGIIHITKSNIFAKDQDEINREFEFIFKKLIKQTLNTVISHENNIFQSLNYKLYIMKLV